MDAVSDMKPGGRRPIHAQGFDPVVRALSALGSNRPFIFHKKKGKVLGRKSASTKWAKRFIRSLNKEVLPCRRTKKST